MAGATLRASGAAAVGGRARVPAIPTCLNAERASRSAAEASDYDLIMMMMVDRYDDDENALKSCEIL